jgi:hypothetical protein
MEALLLAAKDDLEAARDAQRADANTKRRDHDFQEGDMVLLDAPKDHMTYSNPVAGSSKLQHRYGGPHRIIWVRGTAAKLDLGTDLPINPVFHVSRLRHDTTDRTRPQEPIPPSGWQKMEAVFASSNQSWSTPKPARTRKTSDIWLSGMTTLEIRRGLS